MERMTIERQLLELEKSYWQAIQRRDADAAMELSDEPCIVAGAQGVAKISRKALGEMIHRAPYILERFQVMDGAEVRMLRDDVAILAYKVSEDLTVDGKQVTLEAADSSTWVNRDGRWLCAMHTESLSGDAFGRDRAKPYSEAPSPQEVARRMGGSSGGGSQADGWLSDEHRSTT